MLDNVGANLCRKILTMITVLLKFQLKKCQLQCQSKRLVLFCIGKLVLNFIRIPINKKRY